MWGSVTKEIQLGTLHGTNYKLVKRLTFNAPNFFELDRKPPREPWNELGGYTMICGGSTQGGENTDTFANICTLAGIKIAFGNLYLLSFLYCALASVGTLPAVYL